jgi:hypothetical protein
MAKGKLPISKLPTTRGVDTVQSSSYKPSKQELDERRRYQAEDALRDIERAEKHKSNKPLMSDVKQLADEKINCLKKI